MYSFAIAALARLLMGVVGGWLLTVGFTQDQVTAISAQVGSGHSVGTIAIGLASIIIPALWALHSNSAARLIDKAVHVSGGTTSPLAPAASAAKAKAAGTK